MPARYSLVDEERQGLTTSTSSNALRHNHPRDTDADTNDYWDDSGVPAPYRLSTAHSASHYPVHHQGHGGDMQELHASPGGLLASRPAGFASPYPSNRHSLGGRHDTFLPTFESRETVYQKGDHWEEQDSEYGDHQDDAWGLYDATPGNRNSLAQARERYISRKEAALATSGSAYDFAPAKPSRFTKKQKYWMIGGGSFALAVVLAVVIFFATKNSGGSGSADSNSKISSSAKTAGAVDSDPKDPSKFTKDPALHQSMYGLCYTPFNAQMPWCGATQANVTEDVQIMSQLTTRLRLYGADCNTSQLVLQAIQETKVDMQVFLGVWVDNDQTVFDRQVKEIVSAITAYGTDHIAGITVGNEFLLNGGSVTDLLSKIQTVNQTVQALPNLGKVIPVGTADAGSMITTQLASGADYIMANVHPWFGGLPVDQAAGWVYEYTNNNEPSTALLAPNKPQLYVAEAGWPTGANDTAHMTYEGAVAGISELNTFLESFVCQSNTNYTSAGLQPSFVFEAFDEPWKDPLYGGVEAHWGLFTSDKKLKTGITIPDCKAP
ncbi:glycoside hydrolase [Testicularia cyperi]|uniref:glucan endo-1,3-beta-D-glucosidase n=1 Tax=Testicularia cyperi TaxID=1882483 RepID=A0A317XI49_9BASI|nr:glycoside hydrolase [Testicularia cyperi]